jgi:MerR HTH family regulatory protein
MSSLLTAPPPPTVTARPPRAKKPKRREPWSKLAKRHGVSPRTLDRWVRAGILTPPERIRGRKYGDPLETPRLDTTPAA